MKKILNSFKILLLFTLLTGLIYPLLVTGIAQLIFHEKANGSMMTKDGQCVGSALIGQVFDRSIYFSSRPSFTSCNPMPGIASNYSLTNHLLKEQYEERKMHFIEVNQLDSAGRLPGEMLFASASGLDPHISPEAALLQVDRIAKARGFDARQKQELQKCIRELTEPPQLFILGCERINVLLLNLKIDQIK